MAQRFARSFRFRFLAALGGVLLLALISLLALSKWVIFPALHEEERASVDQELDRVERSLQLSQQQLLAQARDWGNWDDTYEFVQGDYPGYTDTNFSQQMFEEMRYQLMAFFNTNGDVYFLAGINPATNQYQTCRTSERECRWTTPLIHAMQASIAEDPQQGKSVLYSGTPPLMVASTPILRTDQSGTPQGWLFKVRPIGEQWLTLMEEFTGLPITLSMVNGDANHTDVTTIIGNTIQAQRYLPSYPINEQIALGTQLERTHYLTSLATFRYVLIWTACLMLLVIGLVLLLLEKIVLKPLRNLTQFTQHVSGNADLSNNMLTRSDEIGMLARAFQLQFKRQQQLNAELIELSTHDPLTGLPNRRLFDQQLNKEVDQTSIHHHPLSVMMIDIDHFKLFNDHYGHPEGDVCLQWVAQAMSDVAKDQGFFIARTGGEEFSAILSNTDLDQAILKSQVLGDAIKGLAIPHQVSPVTHSVSVSIGISQLGIEGVITPSGLMTAADQALYAAKAAGRDCARAYTPELANTTISSYSTPP